MRRWVVLTGALALAACSTPQEAPPAAPPPASRPAPSPPTPRPSPANDACDAKAHQYLVGRPRSEIPVPVKPNMQRVLCTTCPMTMDHNPNRLNFFFDAATGIIKEVRCG
jgi:hypothetical protein